MTITKKQTGTTLEIALEGRLDTVTTPDVEADLKGCLEGIDCLIFDFEKLSYISSAGLRLLLTTHKAMNGKGSMKLVHVNEIVREVFDVTGFSDILDIG